jgi:hypothetical protein
MFLSSATVRPLFEVNPTVRKAAHEGVIYFPSGFDDFSSLTWCDKAQPGGIPPSTVRKRLSGRKAYCKIGLALAVECREERPRTSKVSRTVDQKAQPSAIFSSRDP